MKLDMKKTRLAAAAFVCGFVFCAALVTITQQSPPPPAATGLRLASSQVVAPFIVRLPPDTSPRIIDLRSDLVPTPQPQQLHLIDTRAPQIDIE